MSKSKTDERVIEVTIDGEPADHRILELLERGIDALKDNWNGAYDAIAEEVPNANFIGTSLGQHFVFHTDELQRLSNDLNAAKRTFILKRDFGPKAKV